MAARANHPQALRSYELSFLAQGQEVEVSLTDLNTSTVIATDRPRYAEVIALRDFISGPGFGLETAADADLKKLGTALSEALLPGAVRNALADSQGRGPATLGIASRDPIYRDLPWEFLWSNAAQEGHVALDPTMRIYRRVATAGLPNEPALARRRVLIVVADPQSPRYPHLPGIEAELAGILAALQAAECAGIEVESLRYATPTALRRCIVERPPGVLHFIGHGDIRPSGAALILEGEGSSAESPMYADELTQLLAPAGTQLVVLSCCLSAGLGGALAFDLAESGVPAVIGMQMRLRDRSAHLFSRAVYASLAAGASIEDAVAHGRAAIAGAGPDWGAPVLVASSGLGFSMAGPAKSTSAEGGAKRKHNLPVEDWPFIGRSKEKAELRQLILERRARMITVTGMGGMGKSRLAREEALALAGEFADGVWLIECEALAHAEELVASLGAALGIDANAVTEAAVLEFLEPKTLLLLFDCMERLRDCAPVLTRILRSARGVQILATSRVLLDVPSEREFALDPMSARRHRGAESEAVTLFVEAASFGDTGFRLTAKNRRAVEALVIDLEAVPLALVLAAARLRHMSLEQLSERVRSQRLEVLRRRSTGPNDRHADLLRVVGDSLALLFDEDRALVKALSVFRGGFFLRNALAVLGDSPQVADGIALLRDHSLLRSQVLSSQMRFSILDTIREYLDRIAAPGELAEIRTHHASHFADEAAAVREMFNRGEYLQVRARLFLDIGNFRAAVHHAVDTDNTGLVLRFAQSLARVYFEAGAREEFELLASAAEAAAASANARLLVELHGLHGELCRREALPAKAQAHWLKRAALCRDRGDAESEVDSYLDIAYLAFAGQDFATLDDMLAKAQELVDQISNAALVASVTAMRAQSELHRKNQGQALALCRAAEVVMAQAVDRQGLFVWISLAQIYRAAGEGVDSLRLCEKLLSDGLFSGHYLAVGKALLEISHVREQEGRLDEAAMAITVACAMPRSVSASFRDQALQRKHEFSVGDRAALIADAVAKVAPADWQDHAKRFVASDGVIPAI